MHTRTNKKNKFGTYRLLRYVESVIKKYKGLKHYHDGFLWQCTLPSHSKNKGLTTADIHPYSASRSFLKRHQFKYFGEERVDHPRIRTTYETMREMMGFSEYQISEDMGHADVETTSNYYASDSSSAHVKNQKIRGIQDEMVGDLTDYKRRLVESLYLSELRESVIQSHDEMERKNRIEE